MSVTLVKKDVLHCIKGVSECASIWYSYCEESAGNEERNCQGNLTKRDIGGTVDYV